MLAAALLCGSPAIAAPEPKAELQEKRADLQELKERLKELQQELARTEESRADAADELRETEAAISAASRRLRQLSAERRAAEGELTRIQSSAGELEQRIGRQQAQLERLLHRYYIAGEAKGLGHLLSGSDPNQLARDLHYLKLLSRSEAELLAALRASLAEQRQLAEAAREERDRLAAIEQEHQREVAELDLQKKKRHGILTRLAGQLREQRREVTSLRRDEKRLSRLIEGLARLARRPPPAPRPDQPAPPGAVARNHATPEPLPEGVSFAQLRGKLRLPVRGELINRFGAPRADGGTSWRGIFIRTAAGGEVKAVAPGTVVFADWLRGFGNLIIVDHGDTYMSIYGNNESLYRSPGQAVSAGDAIAAVGDSGGSAESGLYFELRFRGEPIDPLKWVNMR